MHATERPETRRSGREGFTFLEIMVVVLIALIITAMAVPTFVKSYRAASLRASARMLVMTHRYARGMSVLRQQDIAVFLYERTGLVEVKAVRETGPGPRATDLAGVLADSLETDADVEPAAVEVLKFASLQEGVRFEEVEIEKPDRYEEGAWRILYRPSGMCDAYDVTLANERDRTMTVTFDPLSGDAAVEADFE